MPDIAKLHMFEGLAYVHIHEAKHASNSVLRTTKRGYLDNKNSLYRIYLAVASMMRTMKHASFEEFTFSLPQRENKRIFNTLSTEYMADYQQQKTVELKYLRESKNDKSHIHSYVIMSNNDFVKRIDQIKRPSTWPTTGRYT